MWKAVELPLLFAGERSELRYSAVLPERVAGGGVYYFRVAVVGTGEKSQLVQERIVPDTAALQEPEFRDAERSVLAEGIAELKIGYFGRDANAADVVAPTWRDRWEDPQRLPLLMRLDVKPMKGTAWPTLVVEPRRSPEAGCAVWDQRFGSLHAVADEHSGRNAASPDRRAVAHRADHGDRQQLRVQHARRGACARNTMSLSQARAAADGAVERTAFEVSRPRVAVDAWSADGQPHTWTDGDIALTATAYDESARIDLNAAPTPC